jgi:hypothetical protein
MPGHAFRVLVVCACVLWLLLFSLTARWTLCCSSCDPRTFAVRAAARGRAVTATRDVSLMLLEVPGWRVMYANYY